MYTTHPTSHDRQRDEIRHLAEEAFHRKLISGYGDGENPDEFQIVYEGKPRHLPLHQARMFLQNLTDYRDMDYHDRD